MSKLIDSGRGRLVDKWILGELANTVKQVEHHFNDGYQLHLIVICLRDFFYSAFCDYYLETTKLVFRKDSPPDLREHVWNVLSTCCRLSLLLYHPFMPSITEELWQKYRFGPLNSSILDSTYPRYADIANFKVNQHKSIAVSKLQNYCVSRTWMSI